MYIIKLKFQFWLENNIYNKSLAKDMYLSFVKKNNKKNVVCS